jgi:hypothetical protein
MNQNSLTWTACVHIRDSYPIDVLHLNFNILCLLLLYRYLSRRGHDMDLLIENVYREPEEGLEGPVL